MLGGVVGSLENMSVPGYGSVWVGTGLSGGVRGGMAGWTGSPWGWDLDGVVLGPGRVSPGLGV